MSRRVKIITALLIVVMALIALSMPVHLSGREGDASASTACDRGCLRSVVDRYLAAMVAHDPSQAPIAKMVKFTENSEVLKIGDALWGTASGIGSYKLYFADPQAGQAGLEVTIRENGTPAILFLRLRVVSGQITEAETLVHRNADDAKALENMGGPNPVWTQALDASQKTPRAEMLKMPNLYFSGILHSSGDSVPFDPKCNRILDGFQDTNNPTVSNGWFDKGSFKPDAMGIRENMNQGIWTYIHSIDPRRFSIVDEQMGIILAMVMYNHTGTVKFANVKGVGQIPMPAVAMHPSTVEAAEFFKIEAGKIRQIEGVTVALPYGAKSGWDTPARGR